MRDLKIPPPPPDDNEVSAKIAVPPPPPDDEGEKKKVSQPIVEPVNEFSKDIIPSGETSASAAPFSSEKTPFDPTQLSEAPKQPTVDIPTTKPEALTATQKRERLNALLPKLEKDYQEKLAAEPPKPKEQRIVENQSFLGSVENSISNVGTRLEGSIPRLNLLAVDVGEKVLGKELLKNYYQWEGRETPEKIRSDAYKKLDELEGQIKQTHGLYDNIASGNVKGVAAGVVDAVGNVVSTAIPSLLTLGAGLFTETVGQSVYDYNKAKAEANGVTVDDLYKNGQADLAIPTALGTVSGAMEKIGLKGVGNALTRNLKKESIKNVALILKDVNQEGWTEWIQTGLEEANVAKAEGVSDEEIADRVAKKMLSKEGVEAYLMGVAGGGGMAAIGQTFKSINNPTRSEEVKELEDKNAAAMQDLINPNLSPESKQALIDVVYETEQAIDEKVNEDIQEYKELSEEGRVELNNTIAQIDSRKQIIADPNISEATKKTAQSELEGLYKNADEIIKSKKQTDAKENKVGLPSEVGERKEPIKAEPVEEGRGTEVAPSGVLQAQEEKVEPFYEKGAPEAKVVELEPTITPKAEEVAGGEDAQEQPDTRETTATPAQIISEEGFTHGEELNTIYDGLKKKYGDKKGAALYEVANRLVNPNKNTIVEVRGNGVVVKEGEKYILKPFGNTDANSKKWTLYKGIDVTEQFTKPKTNEETKTPTKAAPPTGNIDNADKGKAKGAIRATEKPVPVTDKEAKKQSREAKKQQEEELKKRRKDLVNAEPNDIKQLILQYFYGGGRILTEDFKNETGFGKRGGQQNKVRALKEFKKRIWAHTGKSPSMDDLVMQFQETWNADYGSAEDQQTIRNEIIGVLKDFDSKSQIERELERLFSVGGKIVTSRDERNQSQQEEDLMQRYTPENDEEAAKMEAWEAMNRSQQDFVMENDYTAYLLGRVDEMTEEEAQEHLDNEEKYNQLIKQENENNERESKTNVEDSSPTAGQTKAAKEYEAELADINQKLKDAEKAKRDKLDRISGKVDLFADEAKSNELFGVEQNLSAENIAKQLKPETDKIAKLEAEKVAFEANKENYLKKYDKQTEIVGQEEVGEKGLTEAERIEAQRKSLAERIRKNKIGGLGMHFDFGITKSAYNFAVEMVAKEVENGTKLGVAIAKAIKWIDGQMDGRKWNKGGFARDMNVRYEVTLPDGKKTEVEVEVDGSKETAEMINGWYSPLEQGILDAKIEKTTGREWKKKLAGSTEADEMKWTGMNDFLDTNADKSLTKKEVQDYLKDNRIQIVEVVKSEDGTGTNESVMNDTKFSQYQLEGEKSGYKEVLITMPRQKTALEKSLQKEFDDLFSIPSEKRTEAQRNRISEIAYKIQEQPSSVFKSSHFDEPNILAHLRFSTRVDAEGKRTLFLEELQSDWGQKGKKEGFELPKAEREKADKEYNDNHQRIKDILDEQKKIGAENKRYWELDEEYKKLNRRNLELDNTKRQQGQPTAPFVTDTNAWTKLALKTALQHAVKEGAEKLSWSTGTQQFERWGSEEIHWKKKIDKSTTKVEQLDWHKTLTDKFGENFNRDKVIGILNMHYDLKKSPEEIADLLKLHKVAVDKIIDNISLKEWLNISYDYNKLSDYNAERPYSVLDRHFKTKEEAEKYLGEGNEYIISVNEQSEGAAAFHGNEEGLRQQALSQDNITITSKQQLREAIKSNLSRQRNDAEIDKLADRIWDRMQKEDSGTSLPRKEGMEGFYGVPKEGKLGIVGQVAESMFGKGSVKTTELQTTSSGIKSQDKVLRFRDWVWKNKTEDFTYGDAEKAIKENSDLYNKYQKNIPTQHSIDITPEIKKAVESGLPLFKGLEQRKAELRASISKKLAKARGQLGMNKLPLDVIPDLIELAKIHIQEAIEKGGNALKNFIKDIRENYPDILKNVTDQELEEEIFNKANEKDVSKTEKETVTMLKSDGSEVAIDMRTGGKVTGTIRLKKVRDTFEVSSIAVNESEQKKGDATKLYEDAIKYAKSQGAKGIVSGANEISPAINKIQDKFVSEPLEKGVLLKERKGKQTEPPKEEGERKKKKKILGTRAYEGEISEEEKRYLEEEGLFRGTYSQPERSRQAQEYIDKFGEDAALRAVDTFEIRGALATSILAKMIVGLDIQISQLENTDTEQLDALYKEKALLTALMEREAYFGGEFTGQLGYEYENSDLKFNVEKQIEEFKAANNGVISPETEAKFRELDRQITQLKAQIAEAEDKAKRAEEQAAIQAIQEKNQREKKNKVSEQKTSEKIKKAQKSILAKIEKAKIHRPDIFMAATPASLAWDGAVEVFKQAVDITGDIAVAVARGIENMRETDWYKSLNQEKKSEAEAAFKDFFLEEETVDGRLKIPTSLIRDLVARGHNTIETLTQAVKEAISEQYPDATDREIRDAITGYGKVVNLNQEEIATQIRKITRLGRLISQMEDIQARKRPMRSGAQRDKLDAEERAKMKEVREAMKDLPVSEADLEQQLKTSLDAAKTRLQNQIEDLQREINKGERVPKNARTVKEDKELSDLKEKRDKIKAEHDSIFNNEDVKQAKRLELAKKAAERRIKDLERRIREQDFTKKKPTPLMLDTEIIRLRAEKMRLQEQYEKEIYKAKIANRGSWEIIKETFWDLVGLGRLFNATMDASFVGVQGGIMTSKLAVSNPKLLAQAFANMFRFALSENKTEEFLRKLKSQDYYYKVKGAKLAITEPHAEISAREEYHFSDIGNMLWTLMGRPLKYKSDAAFEKWVELSPFKIFERAAIGFLDTVRLNRYMDAMQMLERQGKTFENDPQAFKNAADVVNTFTGRASLGSLEQQSKLLSRIFYSPRNWASVFKQTILFPRQLVKWRDKETPFKPSVAQKMAILDLSVNIATTLSMVTLAALYYNNDDDDETGVETDARSSDFGKIKIGDMRVDPWGGKVQQVVLVSRIVTEVVHRMYPNVAKGSYKTSDGEIVPLGTPYKAPTWKGLAGTMVGNKLNPATSLLIDYADTRREEDGELMTAFGQPYILKDELKETYTPMISQTAKELLKDDPNALNGFLLATAYFGNSVNVYGQKTKKDILEKHEKAKENAKGNTKVKYEIIDKFLKENKAFVDGLEDEDFKDVMKNVKKEASSYANLSADIRKLTNEPDFKDYVEKVKGRPAYSKLTEEEKTIKKLSGADAVEYLFGKYKSEDLSKYPNNVSLDMTKYINNNVITEEERKEVITLIQKYQNNQK